MKNRTKISNSGNFLSKSLSEPCVLILFLLLLCPESLSVFFFSFWQKKKFQCNEERAVAAFASFTQYSQSYIQGLFLSQYQSTIPCSSCHKNSTTFDPYTSLSLDIPPRPKTVIFVTVTHASPKIPPMKYGFHLQRKATIHELKMELTDQAGIEHCIIVEINSCGMKKVLLDDNPLSILPKIEDCVYAVECGEEVGGVQSESDILLVVSNVERWGKENRRYQIYLILHLYMVTQNLGNYIHSQKF